MTEIFFHSTQGLSEQFEENDTDHTLCIYILSHYSPIEAAVQGKVISKSWKSDRALPETESFALICLSVSRPLLPSFVRLLCCICGPFCDKAPPTFYYKSRSTIHTHIHTGTFSIPSTLYNIHTNARTVWLMLWGKLEAQYLAHFPQYESN